MIDGYKRQINDRKINRWIVRGIDRKIYIEIDWQRDRQIATHGRLVEQFQQNQKLGREEEQERRDVGSTKRDVYLEGGSVQGSLRQQIFMNYVFVPFYIFIIIINLILMFCDFFFSFVSIFIYHCMCTTYIQYLRKRIKKIFYYFLFSVFPFHP